MVLLGISLYCMVLHSITRCCTVLYGAPANYRIVHLVINHNTPFVFIHDINIMAGVLIACRELHWSRKNDQTELYCLASKSLQKLTSFIAGGCRAWDAVWRRCLPGESGGRQQVRILKLIETAYSWSSSLFRSSWSSLMIVFRPLAGPSPPPPPPPLWPSPSFFWQVRAGLWKTNPNHDFEMQGKTLKIKILF